MNDWIAPNNLTYNNLFHKKLTTKLCSILSFRSTNFGIGFWNLQPVS